MKSRNVKFPEVYCDFEKDTVTLEEITKLYRNEYALYAENYQQSFWCPECRKVRISYNNAATPYFSAYPHSSHDDNCTYRQDEMSLKAVEALTSTNRTREEIIRQMDSLMHTLFKSDTSEKKMLSSSNSSVVTRKPPKRGETKIDKRIPRKRIDESFYTDDYKNYKLFYGNIKLRWEEKDALCSNRKILLYHIKTGKFICRICITDGVKKSL